MNKTLLKGLFMVLTAVSCYAQTLTLPSNWVGAGAGFISGAHPPIAGWASYAILLSGKGQVYSFSSYDITQVPGKPLQLQTSARTGFATVLKTVGPIYVLGFGTAGIAATGANTAGAYSGGGIGVWRIGKTDWTLELGVRVAKSAISGTTNAYEFGAGRVF